MSGLLRWVWATTFVAVAILAVCGRPGWAWAPESSEASSEAQAPAEAPAEATDEGKPPAEVPAEAPAKVPAEKADEVKAKMLLHHYQDNILERRGVVEIALDVFLSAIAGKGNFEDIESRLGILNSVRPSPSVSIRISDDPVSEEWQQKAFDAGFTGLNGAAGFVERGTEIEMVKLT